MEGVVRRTAAILIDVLVPAALYCVFDFGRMLVATICLSPRCRWLAAASMGCGRRTIRLMRFGGLNIEIDDSVRVMPTATQHRMRGERKQRHNLDETGKHGLVRI